MGRGAATQPVGAVRRLAFGSSLLAVAAGAVVLLIASRGPTRGLAAPVALSAQASFDRAPISFGDAVTARVIVRADRRAVDLARLRFDEDLAPLARLGSPRTWTVARGRLAVVEYDVRAACLVELCVSTAGPRKLRLPRVRVQAPRRGGGIASAVAAWPVLAVSGRVTAADIARISPPFRHERQAPSPSYPIAPSRLALLLEVAAGVLGVAGALLLGRQVALHAGARRRRAEQRSELALALALVREAQTRPQADRRRALGWLAGLLGPRDERLAGAARRLAWSRRAPVPAELLELVTEVARELEPS